MTGSSSLISKDVRVTLAPSRPRNRIWEIDFLRGACIILMVLDHLTMFLGMYFGPAWFGADMAGDGGAAFCRWCEAFHTSPERAVAHAVVIFIFFSISGISCTFSRSNVRRGIVLAVIAMLYTGVTYAVESLFDVGGIRVTFGVLHFYAACILIWAVIDLLSRDNTVVKVAVSAAIIVVTLCLYYLYTPPADTPVFFAPLFGNGPSGEALFFRRTERRSPLFQAGELLPRRLLPPHPLRRLLLRRHRTRPLPLSEALQPAPLPGRQVAQARELCGEIRHLLLPAAHRGAGGGADAGELPLRLPRRLGADMTKPTLYPSISAR